MCDCQIIGGAGFVDWETFTHGIQITGRPLNSLSLLILIASAPPTPEKFGVAARPGAS